MENLDYKSDQFRIDVTEDVNIGLRGEILAASLQIEKQITDLYNETFQSKIGSTKKFHSAIKIEFKDRLNLLYDANIILDNEQPCFELLMLFRNKFVNDIECNSLSQIVNGFTPNSKSEKKFNEFIHKVSGADKIKDGEIKYLYAYRLLFKEAIKMLIVIRNREIKAITSNMEENTEFFSSIHFFLKQMIDINVIFMTGLNNLNINDDDTKESIEEKLNAVIRAVNEITRTQKHKDLQENYTKNMKLFDRMIRKSL